MDNKPLCTTIDLECHSKSQSFSRNAQSFTRSVSEYMRPTKGEPEARFFFNNVIKMQQSFRCLCIRNFYKNVPRQQSWIHLVSKKHPRSRHPLAPSIQIFECARASHRAREMSALRYPRRPQINSNSTQNNKII